MVIFKDFVHEQGRSIISYLSLFVHLIFFFGAPEFVHRFPSASPLQERVRARALEDQLLGEAGESI